jgi:hypothetical protein
VTAVTALGIRVLQRRLSWQRQVKAAAAAGRSYKPRNPAKGVFVA